MSKTLVERLSEIQVNLKAPKGQMNKFGGYAYRSCEDILEAVKPHLNGLVLTLNDDIQVVNEGENSRVYVTATARITDGEKDITVRASARESLTKKGMDESQITGAASSYARKYALNGLFLIDDTKDADATNNHGKEAPKKSPVKTTKTESKVEKPAKEGPRKGNFRRTTSKNEEL